MKPSKEQVLKESTAVAQKAAGMLGGTFEQGKGFSSGVPISSLESSTPAPLQLPDFKPLNIDASPALAQAQTLNQRSMQEAQQRVEQQSKQVSDTERQLMQTFGITTMEGAERAQLEQQFLAPQQERIDRLQNEIYQQQLDLSQFDKDAGIRMSQLEVEAGKRDITKQTFAAMSREEMVKIGLQKAEKTSSLYANLATADMFNRNYKQAAENIDRAMTAKYEPYKEQLKMEMFFLQRLDTRLEGTQKELAQAKQNEIQREFAEIDRAISNVDAAVASGYASADDIKEMTALSGSPQMQTEYAQRIVAQGAVQERILNNMQRELSMQASRASITSSGLSARKALVDLAMAGDPNAVAQLGFDPMALVRAEQEALGAEEKAVADMAASKEIDRLDEVQASVQKLLGNTIGLQTSSGQFRNATITGLLGFGDSNLGDLNKDRGAFGRATSAFPVIGNIANSLAARDAKATWQAEMGNLLTKEGFDALININERVKLTPITEMEVSLAFRSASALQNAAQYKGEGENRTFVGFAIPEDEVKAKLADVYLAAQKAQAEVAGIKQYGYAGWAKLQELERQAQQQ